MSRELLLGPEGAPVTCEHCGEPTHVVKGGVREDGRDRAIYLAARTRGHREIALAIACGTWGPDSSPEDRYVVSLLARVEQEGSFEFMVVGPERVPVEPAPVLGRQLSRDEALAHPDLEEVFLIGQEVVNEDPRVAEWLAATKLH